MHTATAPIALFFYEHITNILIFILSFDNVMFFPIHNYETYLYTHCIRSSFISANVEENFIDS